MSYNIQAGTPGIEQLSTEWLQVDSQFSHWIKHGVRGVAQQGTVVDLAHHGTCTAAASAAQAHDASAKQQARDAGAKHLLKAQQPWHRRWYNYSAAGCTVRAAKAVTLDHPLKHYQDVLCTAELPVMCRGKCHSACASHHTTMPYSAGNPCNDDRSAQCC